MMRFRFVFPLAFAGACLAQIGRPAGAPAGPQALQSFLGLTDQQMTQLRQLQQQRLQAERPTMQQINAKQQELNQLLATSGADPAAVGRLVIEIANLRQSLPQAGQGLQEQAIAVLTPDQKAKLAQLQDAQKLVPAINQAAALGLIERPAPPPGPGAMGPRGVGPAGRGFGLMRGRRQQR
jgi:Spy/CpxP family protein refolding chaperone